MYDGFCKQLYGGFFRIFLDFITAILSEQNSGRRMRQSTVRKLSSLE